MNSISSIFMALMLIIVVFYGMSIVGDEIYTNQNLDTNSKALITNVSGNLYTNLNYSKDFNEFESNITGNSTFDSEDTFAIEYLEGNSEGNSKQGIIARATKIPDLIILALGVPVSAVTWIRGIILLIIGTFLSFALYRAIFGSGKVTKT